LEKQSFFAHDTAKTVDKDDKPIEVRQAWMVFVEMMSLSYR